MDHDSSRTAQSVRDYLVLPDRVDLNNCDREAIHIPGSIQPHGALVAVTREDGIVRMASANAAEVLGGLPAVMDRPLRELVVDVSPPGLASSVRTTGAVRQLQTVMTQDGRQLDAVLHRTQGMTVVEFEPAADELSLGRLLAQVSEAGAALDGRSLEDAWQIAATTVRRLTGFDRTMIYLFNEDGHGTVVAEDRRLGLDAFLGLQYPASDIPKQARVLYLRNWTRHIVDSAADPSPVLPALIPGTDEPLNMALAQLRAVSPIHLEYLRNMGVVTSLSMSLVSDKQLVGLVACHHYTRRHISFAVRSACELLARLLSEQLARATGLTREEEERERRAVQLGVLRHVAEAGSPERALEAIAAQTLDVFDASAFMGKLGDTVRAHGPVPVEASEIVRMLEDQPDENLIAVQHLSGLADAESGGVLVVRVGNAPVTSFLAWFRPPVTTTTTWGGNPTEGLEVNGDRLTPRGSFSAWSETVRGRCEAWRERDRRMATTLQRALATGEAGLRGEDQDVSTVIDALTTYARDLERANAELRAAAADREEMISAVAHDLRGPLRTMSGFVGVLGERFADTDDPMAARLVERVTGGADHMAQLLNGLQRWGRLGSGISMVTVDLTDAVDTVLQSLGSSLETSGATVRVGPMPVVNGDPALLRELIQNLVENAVKYRDPERPLEIGITSEASRGSTVLSVTDNGVGIDPADVEDIFRMFRQLRPGQSGGIGLGLALVSRIAERHQGHVWVDSTPRVGSTFSVKLPLPTKEY